MHSANGRAHRRALAGLAAGALLLALVPTPATAVDEVANRIAGGTRIDTAVAIAKAAHDAVDDVVLATSQVAADSLPGNALAGALDAALLLTGPGELDDATAEAIEALGASRVWILGGPAAVSSEVEAQLRRDYTVERIGGGNRYETSALVAERIAAPSGLGTDIGGGFGGDDTILVTRGDVPFDAVAASALSYAGTHPILLTRPGALPAEVAAAIRDIGADKALILGGSAAVSAEAQADIEVATGGTPATRLGGEDRNATAAELATSLISAGIFDASTVFLTTGTRPFDALTAGQLAGDDADPSPILLTAGKDLSSGSGQPGAFLFRHEDALQRLFVIGGRQVVSTAVADAAVAATQETAGRYSVPLSWINENTDRVASPSSDDDTLFGQGEPGATGYATLSLDPDRGHIEFTVDYRQVTGPFGAAAGLRIHRAPLDENGQVALTLATGAQLDAHVDRVLTGTVTSLSNGDRAGSIEALMDDLLANPSDFYLNLHSNGFPAGAIRGQIPDGDREVLFGLARASGLADNQFSIITSTGQQGVVYDDSVSLSVDGEDASEAEFEAAYSAGDAVIVVKDLLDADGDPQTPATDEFVSVDLTNRDLSGPVGSVDRNAGTYTVLGPDGTSSLATVGYRGGQPVDAYVVDGESVSLAAFEAALTGVGVSDTITRTLSSAATIHRLPRGT